MNLKSYTITQGRSRAGARSMLKGIGLTDEDLKKPMVLIANTWIETMPCNLGLRTLAHAVKEAKAQIKPCPECGFFSEEGLCEICRDANRDSTLLCIVEHAPDVLNFERSGAFKGKYHVLGGLLSPLDGIGPEELKIPALLKRTKQNKVREVILGFGTDARGETTALFLAKELAPTGAKITRLATGVAAGAGLEFVDSITLGQALSHRREL